MRYADLVEAAEDDFSRVNQAQGYANAFLNWLKQHNTETPLDEIDGFTFWETTTHKGIPLKVLSVAAWKIGLNLDDLSFGICWSDDHASERGWLLSGYQDNRRHYYALLNSSHDPRQETEVVWGLHTSSLVHEVIHYFDHVRGFNDALYRRRQWQAKRERETGRRSSERPRTMETYYNDPLELNAHFQQAVAEMLGILASNIAQKEYFNFVNEARWLDSFAAFYEKFQNVADRQKYQYLPSLTRANRQRVIRRLYKLYTLIKTQWPNLPEIQQQAAAFVAQWRAQDDAQQTDALAA